MKVSLLHLNRIARGIGSDPEDVAERLARRGAPVEGIRSFPEGLEDIVVGKVLEAKRHPGADRLWLCRVDAGGEEAQVVCGAPVVLQGRCYPFAPVGARIPAGFTIGKRKIRGVVSQGMLCSERELGLGEDHAGILLLEGEHAPGAPLPEALGIRDYQLDVEVTPNRGDLLSHVGIARELAPGGDADISLPELGQRGPALEWERGGDRVRASGIEARIETPKLCRRYMGVVIRDLEAAPSPAWLRERLLSFGARPINCVVDAANYVMLEVGQPLHAFDLARVRGSRIEVDLARPGETIETLDGEERELSPEILTIRDRERPIAIAGVMGGANSEVGSGTTEVLLECAHFEPASVRSARRALDVSTDASYRFERWVDPQGMEAALERCVRLILEVAGGSVDGPALDAHPRPWRRPTIDLRPSRVKRILGVGFKAKRIGEMLSALGYEVEVRGEDLCRARVPGWRAFDTTREVDLVEEVARARGYDSFPDEVAPFLPAAVPDDPLFQLQDRLRARLVGWGLSEAQTPALGPPDAGEVPLANPVSARESRLRSTRLAGLIGHVERNHARGVRDVRLFEFGTAFQMGEGDGGLPPKESPRAAAIIAGARRPLHWSAPQEPFDLFDIAALMEAAAELVCPGGDVVAANSVRPNAGASDALRHLRECFDERALYELRSGQGLLVGYAGRIAPRRMNLPRWAGQVLGLEVDLSVPPKLSPFAFRELPQHPPNSRDAAFLLEGGVTGRSVLEAIRGAGDAMLTEVEVFDLYQGGDLPPGSRSLAVRMRFQAQDRTLSDREVDGRFQRVLREVERATGVQRRG